MKLLKSNRALLVPSQVADPEPDQVAVNEKFLAVGQFVLIEFHSVLQYQKHLVLSRDTVQAANATHNLPGVHKRKLVRVQCAAIDNELVLKVDNKVSQ